jgi:glycine cleavage system pyridoxal-binding protein P
MLRQASLPTLLQTREQHIRREKAHQQHLHSAGAKNMAAMYAVYHGPEAEKHTHTCAV